MNTHTPGPWFADASFVGSAAIDRFFVACNSKDLPGGRDEAEANARLIAAAPELLTHLQRLVAAIDRAPANFADGLADEARTAIAKATGEQ